MADEHIWPDVNVGGWAPTKRSFHLYAQMLGKLRVALSPAQPNWLFTSLQLSARGLTTGTMPWRGTAVEAMLDVFSSEAIVQRSNGKERRISLLEAGTVAEVYAALQSALVELGVECAISPIPQELPDVTPLPEDHRPARYDPDAVRRWFAATTACANVFEQWRSHFFGRSGVQVWWGALDVALLLFNGKHVAPPTNRGYLLKYDLDAELMSAGLYFGDENTPPYVYGYIFPEPPGAATLPMAPTGVSWSDTIREWVLPYETVRAASNPAARIRSFLDALYDRCVDTAGWDRAGLSYVAPPRKIFE